MKIQSSLLGMIAVTLVYSKGCFASKAEDRLLKDLFTTYVPDARPVISDGNAVNVTLGLSLSQLIDVDEKNQILTLGIWMRQKWDNPVLAWDDKEYNGIKSVNIEANKVWKPDIVLYNCADENVGFGGNFDRLNTRVIMSHTGRHTWLAPVIIKSKCDIDIKNFPFDEQRCILKFGSWTYDGLRLNLINESSTADLGSYLPNAEWFLVKVPVVRNERFYICCPSDPYPDVTYTVIMKRRTLFYLTNLIFPTIVIFVLNLMAFILPAESGERISLVITLLLATTFFMLSVADMIPATSEVVPTVGVFFNAAMAEMILMISVLCFISVLHHKEPTDPPMPIWMRTIILENLSYLLGIRKRVGPTHPVTSSSTEMRYLADGGVGGISDTQTDMYTSSQSSMSQSSTNDFVDKRSGDNTCQPATELLLNEKSLSSKFEFISQKLDTIVEKIDGEKTDDKIKEEWRVVAKTIDQLFLYFFTFTIIVTAIICFLQSPRYVP